ncbi:MAG: hypothetical protein HUU10_04475 [Bacteroidetes bacterium]|nr:hypothetical protein [Bacteroidota bacterium]
MTIRTFRGDTWEPAKNWTLENIYDDPKAIVIKGGKFTVWDMLGVNKAYTGPTKNGMLIIEPFTDIYKTEYSAEDVLKNCIETMAQMESINLFLNGKAIIRENQEGVFYRNQAYAQWMRSIGLKPATRSYHFAGKAVDFDEEGASAEQTRRKLDKVWPFRMETNTPNWVHIDTGKGVKRFKP